MCGVIHNSAERFAEASAAFSTAVLLEPQNAGALRNRGAVRLSLAELDAARQDFQSALAIDGSDRQAKMMLAIVFKDAGDLVGAQAILAPLARSKKATALVHYNLACVLALMGDTSAARTVLARAIKMNAKLAITARKDVELRDIAKPLADSR